MSIRKFKNAWWVDIGFEGKRYRKRSPDNHRPGAIAYEQVLRNKLSRGERIFLSRDPRSRTLPQSEQPLRDFVKEWFETHVDTYLKPSTRRKYEAALGCHILPHFGGMPLAAILGGEIQRFAGKLVRGGLRPKTANCVLSVLRKCLTSALEWERLERLPRFRWLRCEPARFDFLSSEESARLLSVVQKPPHGLLVHVALRTGMRIGELLGLHWEDVDLERRLITVRRSRIRNVESSPKTNRQRHIPIAADLHEALSVRTPGDGPYVFSLHGDGVHPLNDDVSRRHLRRAAERAGLRPIGWHVLRHTFASQLVSESVSIYIVQALLGHTTVQMTMRYAHLAPSAMRGAVETLKSAEMRAAVPLSVLVA